MKFYIVLYDYQMGLYGQDKTSMLDAVSNACKTLSHVYTMVDAPPSGYTQWNFKFAEYV